MKHVNSVFVSNSDTAIGQFIAKDLLAGKRRECFEEVYCAARQVNKSGCVWAMGANVVQVQSEPDSKQLEQALEQCDTLVLVPDCSHDKMVQEMEAYMKCAKQSRISTLILISHLGADEEGHVCRQYKQMEEMGKRAGIDSFIVVRIGLLQQSLFFWTDHIKYDRELPLPWKNQDSAKCAPLNLADLACFVEHLCAEGADKLRAWNKQMFRLTGNELLTGHNIVTRFNQQLGDEHKIEFKEVSFEQCQKHLHESKHLPKMAVQHLIELFQLINSGKLAILSHDEKKTIGSEPVPIERWAKEYKHRFVPSGQRAASAGVQSRISRSS